MWKIFYCYQRYVSLLILINHYSPKIRSVIPTDGCRVPAIRHLSTQYGTQRNAAFHREIRNRDGGCVLTCKMVPRADRPKWKVFDAALCPIELLLTIQSIIPTMR